MCCFKDDFSSAVGLGCRAAESNVHSVSRKKKNGEYHSLEAWKKIILHEFHETVHGKVSLFVTVR